MVWLLKDEIRDFSNSAIELAKSQNTKTCGNCRGRAIRKRRAEESAKPETRSAETADWHVAGDRKKTCPAGSS